MNNDKTKKLVWAGLFTALTTVATLIKIPFVTSPNGYVNAGDGLVIVSAFLLNPLWGAMAAGLGSALADVFYGFFNYAPATFIIKALMALAAGVILRKFRSKAPKASVITGSIIAEIIMVSGYFAYETLLYGVEGAIGGVIGNCVQAGFGAVVGIFLFFALLRIPYVKNNF